MNAKKFFVCLLIPALALSVYAWSNIQLRELRKAGNVGVNVRDFPFPVNFYKVAAGEFSGLSADFLYLDIAAVFGGRDSNTLSSEEWDRMQKAFAVGTGLDPWFEPTFRAIQAYLPWSAERYEETIDLLEPVHDKRTWHWLPTFFIGFDHYFFLWNNAEASRWFLLAAQRENASPLLATLGARLAAESGNAAMGIDFLQRMMATAQEESIKKKYRQRITALEGQLILERAVARFRADFGKNPPELLMLVLHGYIPNMPYNPYYANYFYQDGVVRFDPFPTKGIEADRNKRAKREQRRGIPPFLKKPAPQA